MLGEENRTLLALAAVVSELVPFSGCGLASMSGSVDLEQQHDNFSEQFRPTSAASWLVLYERIQQAATHS